MLIPFHLQAVPVGSPVSDPGWLTQPVATVIAAGVALVVACVTLLGIWLNHRQHLEKETSAAVERRRNEAREALVEALDVSGRAWSLVGDAHSLHMGLITDGNVRMAETREALAQCRAAQAKLELLALDGDGAMRDLTQVLGQIWYDIAENPGPGYVDFKPAWAAHGAAISSFRTTMNRLRTKYDPLITELPLAEPERFCGREGSEAPAAT
ncbi:hypothetical protein [Rhodococcus sp. W8901]|uniref:hypothetical protein n=1 Tax=Rhodococcus sp. W8901 TaxID=2742603 RepID=UPI001582E079|nr:hypothetical protein [Rhodococcus sp. W8901]QKT12146.1 hypothetical protein HUN07_16815 [Rhodococcus sp. W8901]